MEVDYIPGSIGPKSKAILDAKLDYTVGSVHFVDSFPDGRGWEIDGSHQVFWMAFKGYLVAMCRKPLAAILS
jgi:histidinol-phosphatase (PHP family)